MTTKPGKRELPRIIIISVTIALFAAVLIACGARAFGIDPAGSLSAFLSGSPEDVMLFSEPQAAATVTQAAMNKGTDEQSLFGAVSADPATTLFAEADRSRYDLLLPRFDEGNKIGDPVLAETIRPKFVRADDLVISRAVMGDDDTQGDSGKNVGRKMQPADDDRSPKLIGRPKEVRLTRAGRSFEGDLRDLPYVPPVRKERFEREPPEVDRGIIRTRFKCEPA